MRNVAAGCYNARPLKDFRALMIRPVSAFVVGMSLALAGCAPAAKRDPRDPFEPINRVTYRFNDAVDRAVLKPVAKGYKKVAPQFVQTGVSNFFDNLFQPTVFLSDVLQAKFKPAANDMARFVLNTTVGIGGFLDPATAAGLDKNDEDLGQAFGKWGIGPGPYLVIPLLGFSDVRDGIGSAGQIYTSPIHYVERDAWRYSLNGVEVIDTRARLLETEKALEGTFDRYAFIRNAYLQRREYQVTDGNVPPVNYDDLQDPEAEDAPEQK